MALLYGGPPKLNAASGLASIRKGHHTDGSQPLVNDRGPPHWLLLYGDALGFHKLVKNLCKFRIGSGMGLQRIQFSISGGIICAKDTISDKDGREQYNKGYE
ncbi:hypothetical protein SDC9_203414 [bioreactor metagenome]|uniref:Uncharacterized protein n=1 Tax=bioreactor metagenome TaxID=1076179 RepID=A0A645IXX7_9ZZZZ